MNPTQKYKILAFLRSKRFEDPYEGWVRAYSLRGAEYGHQADRRARELAQAELIEHRLEGKFAAYRYRLEDSERAYLREKIKQQTLAPITLQEVESSEVERKPQRLFSK